MVIRLCDNLDVANGMIVRSGGCGKISARNGFGCLLAEDSGDGEESFLSRGVMRTGVFIL
jgi:hypothetical protein